MLASHIFDDTIVSIYFVNRGQGVKRHVHSHEHSTGVAVGMSEVIVEGQEPFFMKPGDPDYVLPANKHHEIRAVEDGSVIVHISKRNNTSDTQPTGRGGVLMHDGTVVYPNGE